MKKPAIKLTLEDVAQIVSWFEDKNVMFKLIIAPMPKPERGNAAIVTGEADN